MRACFLIGLLFVCGCKGERPTNVPTVEVVKQDNAPVSFSYDSLDAREVSSAATRGKPTVIAFVTTWDLMSQAEVDFVVAMSKTDAAKINYVLVALQEPTERELIEVYIKKLGVTFPTALADRETIAGGGPFGDVHTVPSVVVLDQAGRIVWRHSGLSKSAEIRDGLRKVE